jgi:hypothetical protein
MRHVQPTRKEARMAAPKWCTHSSLVQGIALGACIGVTLMSGACHHNIEVRTVSAPGVSFAGRTTFRILTPRYRGTTPLAANDPMVENSITYQALREEIRRALEAKGYRYMPQGASLDIAYYATTQPVVDYRTWDYGYTWRGIPLTTTEVVQYEQGTVVIDVIDPTTHQLLWRGQGAAPVDRDPNKYIDVLRRAVDAIVDKLPPAS